jgi:hypothetical protein
MDSTSREILVMVLERLRHVEKARQEDLATLIAAVRTLRSLSPAMDERFQSEKDDQDEKAELSDLVVDDAYNGLIRLLKGPSLNEKEQQEKLRSLLEALEGSRR